MRRSLAQPLPLPPQRLRAGLVALVCALAYLGAVVHFALVRHVSCAVHGELLHADASPPEQAASPLLAPGLGRADAPGVPVHAADAHCAHTLLRRELPPEAPAHARAAHAVPEQLAALSPQCSEGPVAPLHLAPKASPPPV